MKRIKLHGYIHSALIAVTVEREIVITGKNIRHAVWMFYREYKNRGIEFNRIDVTGA